MKYTIIYIAVLLLASPIVFAQSTKGGTIKNFEKHKVSYDTIVTENKIPIEQFNSGFYSIFFSLTNPTFEHSQTLMSQADYFNSPYYMAPFTTGQVGLKRGFSLGISQQAPLNFINKHLIRNIDFGLNTTIGFNFLNYNWQNMIGDSYEISNMFDNAKYRKLSYIQYGIGPSVTYIHQPSDPKFMVDFYFRFNYNDFFLRTPEDLSYNPNNSTIDVDAYFDDLTNITSFNTSFGLNFRLKESIYFKIEKNRNLTFNNLSITESIDETGYDTWGNSIYNYYSQQLNVSSLFRLDNIQFGLGIAF
jgi:hypothetical protein